MTGVDDTIDANPVDRITLSLAKTSTVLDSFNIEMAAGTSATSIKSAAAALAGVGNVQYMLFMTYNALETTTPKVQVVVDTVATVANDFAGGMYTSSITVATTSLTYPVQIQGFFYEAY